MANGRNSRIRVDASRDSGGFVALPWSVLDCPAYATLSYVARALLLEVARQIGEGNNGRLLLTTDKLRKRGWFSVSVAHKAKQELLDAKFIFEMAKGQRPNRASWYAVGWRRLDRMPGFDPGAEELFERGAYMTTQPKPKKPKPGCQNPKKNSRLIPCAGTQIPTIAPVAGTQGSDSVPAHGSIRAAFDARSIPAAGNHLEMPSPGTAGVRV